MGGLGAIFRRGGDLASAADVDRMAAALRPHGTPRRETAVEGPFGLAWTAEPPVTDEDRFDRQPVGPAGAARTLFAGFLYHRGELVAQLGLSSMEARELADSALAHAAWRKWGERCVEHLNGPYTLIAAEPAARRLFVLRAREGAPPVYYHVDRARVAVATAASAIFALGDVARDLDERRIADALVLNAADCERSFYAHIRKLPLGRLLEAGPDGATIRDCAPPVGGRGIRFARDADYPQAAQELLDRAVASAMRASVPPAIALSGGYDSGAVAVTALGPMGPTQRLSSYTAVPEAGWDGTAHGGGRIGDESNHVRALAALYPALDPHFVDAAGAAYDRDLDALIALAEEPPAGVGNLTWSVELNRQAHRAGHRALLVGASGNATLSFSGRASYPYWLRSGRWTTLMRELRAASGGGSPWRRGYSLAVRPLLPAVLARALARQRGHGEGAGYSAYSAIHPDYAAAMAVDERARAQGWDHGFRGFSSPQAMMRAMITGGARDQGQAFRYAMAAYTGIESRDPLGDRRIVDFCLGIPPEQFLRDGEDRRLIRRMMAGRLPAPYFALARGRQGADWHLRITRDLPRYRAEIDRLADDPDLARRFDVARLRHLIKSWPRYAPADYGDHPDYLLAMYGLGRALAMARFIEWAKGQR